MELGLLVDWRTPLFWWRSYQPICNPLQLEELGWWWIGQNLFLLVWSGYVNIWRIAKWLYMLIFSNHEVPAHFFQCMQRARYQAGEREGICHYPHPLANFFWVSCNRVVPTTAVFPKTWRKILLWGNRKTDFGETQWGGYRALPPVSKREREEKETKRQRETESSWVSSSHIFCTQLL